MRNRLLVFIIAVFVSATARSQICDCWIPYPDSTYTLVPMPFGPDTGGAPYYRCNNCSSGPIALPFHFCFYGKSYDTVYINNKGNLTFVNPIYAFSNTGLQFGPDTPMIAPFRADIDDRPAPISHIFYYMNPTNLIVQWEQVGYQVFDNDLYDNFQVTITNGSDSILPPGNNVSFCYYTMQWASADSSGGSGGFGGVPAKVGVCKGDGIHYAQIGAFDYPGYTFAGGDYDSNSKLYWIENKSFIFNTCVSGNNIGPVILDPDLCYTDTVCAGDTVVSNAQFLCPEQGQTAKLTVSAPGLTGITTDTLNSFSIYRISCQLVTTRADTGSHTITVTATDNSVPPLTNSMKYTIVIKNCDTTSGINELKGNSESIIVYPNPNNGKFTVICHSERSEKSLPIMKVYNVLGENVLTGTLRSAQGGNEVDLNQPPGIYFYRVTADNGYLIGEGKFVIQ